MVSWRDSLSETAHRDLDSLLASALRIAQGHLAQVSEFTPFALIIDNAGRLLAVDLDLAGLGKHPDEHQIAAATTAQLATLSHSARGTALALNTRLSKERTDAIEVRLEHQEGVALLVLVPYKRPKFGGRTEYSEARTFTGTKEVWK